MGATFPLIHDEALFPCSGTVCHFCESDDVPIYEYNGVILHPDHAANPELAREEPEVSELCAKCILGGHIEKEIEPSIQATLNRFATDKQAALAAFQRTPDIPLFLQFQDWPMCCGQWCEFIGIPASYEESTAIPNQYRYWEREPRAWLADYDLMPESLREISLFRCLLCAKQFFTWQFT